MSSPACGGQPAFRCANPLPKPLARVEGRDAPATTSHLLASPCHTLSRHPAKHKPAWSALPGAARAATVEWAVIGPPRAEPPQEGPDRHELPW